MHPNYGSQNSYKDFLLLMSGDPGSKNIGLPLPLELPLLAGSESAGPLRTGMVIKSPLGSPDVFWDTLEGWVQLLACVTESCLCLQVSSVLS